MATKTMTKKEQELAETEAWLDSLDPETTPAEDPVDLRALAEANDGLEQAERSVAAAVDVARAAGRSWAQIGMILGISRQAAQQRFGGEQPAPKKRPGPAPKVVRKATKSGPWVKTESGRARKKAIRSK
jgi:hypothetical protein